TGINVRVFPALLQDSGAVLDRKKLAAFLDAAGRFLRFPIGDRRCNRTRASVGNAGGNARPSAPGRFLRFPIGDRRRNRTRASVGNAGGNARPSLTNATLAASRLLHRRSPTAPCSKGALAAHRKKLAAFSALGGFRSSDGA